MLTNQRWGGDAPILSRIYRATTRAVLDYGNIVYASAAKSHRMKVQRVQNQALRIILGAFRTSPASSLHVEADEMNIKERQEKLTLQYIYNEHKRKAGETHTTVYIHTGHTYRCLGAPRLITIYMRTFLRVESSQVHYFHFTNHSYLHANWLLIIPDIVTYIIPPPFGRS